MLYTVFVAHPTAISLYTRLHLIDGRWQNVWSSARASKSFAGGGDGALNKATQRSHRVLPDPAMNAPGPLLSPCTSPPCWLQNVASSIYIRIQPLTLVLILFSNFELCKLIYGLLMSPDAACLKSSPLSAPGCPGVQTHCVHHPILVRFSVLSGVMEWLCVLVSVLVCISCPLHPDQCPMPSWCVPLCPPLHSNAMHPILFPVHTNTNHFNYV